MVVVQTKPLIASMVETGDAVMSGVGKVRGLA
jgi:hypothetical protein